MEKQKRNNSDKLRIILLRYGNYPMSSPIPDEQFLGDEEVARGAAFYPYNLSHHLKETNDDDSINSWLNSLGLDFNPFFALNAADDPHLGQYLIDLEVFDVIWGDGMSLVFEPAGGGKTALRVRTSQACWNTQDINRPFPIPYNPPFLKWGSITPTLDDHLDALTVAGAEQLLLGLCHRPHWLLNMDRTGQRSVGRVLTWSFSSADWADSVESLRYHLDDLRATLDLEAFSETLDPTFYVTDRPDLGTFKRFCDVLDGLIDSAAPPPARPAARWAILGDVLLNQLHFPSIYILLDGLDATLETTTIPAVAVLSLAPLLARCSDWLDQRVYLKGFLPSDTKPVLEAEYPQLLARSRTASIHWDAARLVELIRQRVFVASRGQFNSLDAIVTPGLRDFEDILVESVVAPRPREILTLINDIFAAHVHHNGITGKLEDKDWEFGLKKYRQQAVQPVLG